MTTDLFFGTILINTKGINSEGKKEGAGDSRPCASFLSHFVFPLPFTITAVLTAANRSAIIAVHFNSAANDSLSQKHEVISARSYCLGKCGNAKSGPCILLFFFFFNFYSFA